MRVVDNSGVEFVKLIRPRGRRRTAGLGSRWAASVKRCTSGGTHKEGDVVQVVLVRTKDRVERGTGRKRAFREAAAVLVNKEGAPVGSRISGPVPGVLRRRGRVKIVTRSEGVV